MDSRPAFRSRPKEQHRGRSLECDPLNAEECWATVQIPWPEDHSEPSIRQAALERLRDLVTQGLREFRDLRTIDDQ